jgi:hypothetical protein
VKVAHLHCFAFCENEKFTLLSTIYVYGTVFESKAYFSLFHNYYCINVDVALLGILLMVSFDSTEITDFEYEINCFRLKIIQRGIDSFPYQLVRETPSLVNKFYFVS